MSRGFAYTTALLAGCVAGIVLGFTLTRGSLANLRQAVVQNDAFVPTMLAQQGTVRSVDTLSRTIVLDTTTPYDTHTDMTMRITYDSATAYSNQFAKPTSLENLTLGSSVRVSISRRPGAFYALRVVTL